MAHKNSKEEMNTVYWDCETRSGTGIKRHGAMRHVSDPDAGLNCIQWAWNNGPVDILNYYHCLDLGGAVMRRFFDALFSADRIVAHYALFERAVLRKILKLNMPPGRWHDTMAKARYYGYPGGLDDAAKALRCSVLKDIQGKPIMEKLATGKYTPDMVPDDFNRLYSYGANDVRAMREIDLKLPELPPEVQEQWELDVEINERGMPVDLRAVNNALVVKHQLELQNNQLMAQLTNGYVVTVGQTDKIREFAIAHGVDMVDCTADTVRLTLLKPIPMIVRRVLELRQEAGLSSLAKYKKFSDHSIRETSRLYHQFSWYGAHTGRPTGGGDERVEGGVQALNLARAEDAAFWAEILSEQPAYFYQISKAAERLKESSRGVICAAEGNELLWVDLAQIEARATGWVAGEQKFLDLFLTSDPYCTYGRKLFDKEITKKDNPDERQASKATVLAYGFAGGIGAGQRVASNYHIDFSGLADVVMRHHTAAEWAEGERNYQYYLDKQPVKPLNQREGIAVDILKQRYRRDFPNIVKYWDILEQAFLLGGWAGPIHVDVRAGNLRVVTLPSGRQLFYHNVKIFGDGRYCYQSREGISFLWKGVLIENVAQAINADISDWYKLRANKHIAPVVHHCYDEFTLEVPALQLETKKAQLKDLCENNKPDFCKDLPLGFDYNHGRRYGK